MRFSLIIGGAVSLVSYAFMLPAHANEPQWEQLPAHERQVLAPLSKEWNHSSDTMRKRWRHLAQRYPTLKPEEQKRVKERLEKWASLTPEARADARKRFKNLSKTLPVKQTRAIKWENYQHLPDHEKSAFSGDNESIMGQRP